MYDMKVLKFLSGPNIEYIEIWTKTGFCRKTFLNVLIDTDIFVG